MDILGTQNWLGTPSLQSPKSWQQNTTFMGGFNSLHTCIVFTKRFVNFFPWHSWKLRWTLFTTIPGCQDIKKEAGQGHHPFKTKEREWFGKAAVESNSNKSSYTSPPSWCVSLNGHEYHGGWKSTRPFQKKRKRSHLNKWWFDSQDSTSGWHYASQIFGWHLAHCWPFFLEGREKKELSL